MKKKIYLGFLSLFFCSIVSAQAKPLSEAQLEVIKWEYLVVCFGKTYFDFPNKLNIYFTLSESGGDEGIKLQNKLDVLGKYGWELVSIVGTIGGDQQFVLKRKISSANAKLDEIALEESLKRKKLESEQWAKERQEKEALEKASLQKRALLDLDKWEIKEEGDKENAEAEAYIRLTFDEINASNIIRKDFEDYLFRYDINIEYDLTESHLSNTNEYRKSLVQRYLSQRLEEIDFDLSKISYKEIVVTISGYIYFQNEFIEVGKVEKTFKYN